MDNPILDSALLNNKGSIDWRVMSSLSISGKYARIFSLTGFILFAAIQLSLLLMYLGEEDSAYIIMMLIVSVFIYPCIAAYRFGKRMHEADYTADDDDLAIAADSLKHLLLVLGIYLTIILGITCIIVLSEIS
jgi:hypothetical protein